MNGTESNVATKWFFGKMVKYFPPGFVHPCPWFGELKGLNFSINTSPETPQFLAGTYRILSRYFVDVDDNILTTQLIVDFKDVPEFQLVKKKSSKNSNF